MSFWPTQACTIPKVIILKLRECSWGAGSIILWIIIKANVWNTPVRNPLLGPLASKTEAFEASEHIIKLVIVTVRWARGFKTHVILTQNGSCHLQPSACLEHALIDYLTIQKSHLSVLQNYAELFILNKWPAQGYNGKSAHRRQYPDWPCLHSPPDCRYIPLPLHHWALGKDLSLIHWKDLVTSKTSYLGAHKKRDNRYKYKQQGGWQPWTS